MTGRSFRRLRGGLCAIAWIAGVVVARPAPVGGIGSQGQVTSLPGTDFFDAERDTGAPRPDSDNSQYTVVIVKMDLGDSALNTQQRRSLWNRFLGQFWKDSKAGSFSIAVGDRQPVLLYAVVKDANDDQLDPSLGDKRVSPPLVVGPADSLPVIMNLDFSDRVESSIVSQALRAAGVIAMGAGGAPAALIKKVPDDATKAVDRFLGTMSSTQRKVSPSFQIAGSDLRTNFTYTLTLYDAAKSNSNRQKVATIRIRTEQFPSLYKSNLPLQNVDDFQTSVLHKTLDGKTEQEGGRSIYTLIRDDSIYASSLRPLYADYLTYCRDLPNALSRYGFSDTDVTLQMYAFLSVAEGVNKRHDANVDVCPGGTRAATMRRLGLPKLPPEDYDPSRVVDRDALRMVSFTSV